MTEDLARGACDYELIHREHKLDYGRRTGWLRRVLARLFSNRTQFIFELIQNAEDAGATRIRFDLRPERVVVEHDGRRFTERDVQAICAIAESDKEEREHQIGRFGIGFKSVYAYTERPHVHCPPEHFCIEEFVLPRAVETVLPGAGWTTRFELPFDRPDLSPAASRDEIASALEKLSARTLLFLTNLTELEWRGDARGGVLRRESGGSAPRIVTVTRGTDPSDRWAVFRDVVSYDGKNLNVELAFRLVDVDGLQRVRPTDSTELVVFFPTQRQTGLGFLLQAPFVVNITRENMQEAAPLNRLLVERAAGLLVIALERLRDLGWLDGFALEALPLRQREFAEGTLLRPLYDIVRVALRDRALLPTADGSWASARALRMARSRNLRELLSGEQLTALLGTAEGLSWIAGDVSERTTPGLHQCLIGHTPSGYTNEPVSEPLVPDFEIRAEMPLFRRFTPSFLAEQSNEWMCRFYALLGAQRAGIAELRTLPIVRLETGDHVRGFDDRGRPSAWLPPGTTTDYPTVKAVIAADPDARKFLLELGLDLPDEIDDLVRLLERSYGARDRPSAALHVDLLRRLAAALSLAPSPKRDRLLEVAKRLEMFRARNAGNGAVEWRAAKNVVWAGDPDFRAFLEGVSLAWVLDEPDPPADLWTQLGVPTRPPITYRTVRPDGFVPIVSSRKYRRGVSHFDPDFTIQWVYDALRRPASLAKSRYLWKLLQPYARALHGFEQTSTERSFAHPKSEDMTLSPTGALLRKEAWLPDQKGQFHRPDELQLDDLPEDFARDATLARALGMVAAGVRNELARTLGLDDAQLDMLIANRAELPELLAAIERKERSQPKPSLPPAAYLAERQTAGGEDVEIDDHLPEGGPRTATSVEETTRRVQAIPKLVRDQIKHAFARALTPDAAAEQEQAMLEVMADYAGRCQVCSRTFVQRDGSHSCQSLQLQPVIGAAGLPTAGNRILLCGWHAALWKEGRFTWLGESEVSADELRRHVLETTGRREIPIVFHQVITGEGQTRTVAVHETIRYSGPHWHALQVLMKGTS